MSPDRPRRGGAAGSLDEDDVRVRPQRGKSRPRTKERPVHEHAAPALVIAVDRGRYTCLLDSAPGSPAASPAGSATDASGEPRGGRVVVAMRARELGRKAVVVGDRVGLVGDLAGGPDALARIVRIEPRRTALRRTADDDDPVERMLVANADQLVIVTALADPEPRPRLVDRCLVAAYDAGLEPLLCLTKADLAPPDALLALYRPLAVRYVVTSRGADLRPLTERLAGRTNVLVGHSGVGKSTLVNALVPGAGRSVGVVNTVTGRGRHTSASAVALPLPAGGWVIDTPGVRSFGLAHVDPRRLIHAFGDLSAGTEGCPRGCTHADTEPECALDGWVEAGRADPARLASYRRLLASRTPAEDD